MNNYKKIAELLYPNVKKELEYYTNIYKKRNLPVGAEVTRLAPSPTGYFHIGGIYQGIIDRQLAKQSGGVFYLRLEDTDQKREIKEAGEIAYNTLDFFGLLPDEGYRGGKEEIGEYGPYVQSKRVEIYQTFAKHLVSIGRAFPCFCDKSENKTDVVEKREKELTENNDIKEHDICRNLSFEEIEKNIKEQKPFAIRLKSTGDPEKSIVVEDRIKGVREIRENGKDIVLMKSNGVPPYAFAHLVDDTLMGTTTVVRGEEWYQSLASHIELFEAFGTSVRYAHTPVICKFDEEGNKRKLSKRKDPEADSRTFIERGYPTIAVIEYLINLANSDFEEWRLANPDKSYEEFNFSLEKIGSNNPIFDISKLNNVSKNIIAKMTKEEVYKNVLEWANIFDKDFASFLKNNKEYSTEVFGIERGGDKPRKDICMWSEIKKYYNYMFLPYEKLDINFDFNDKVNNETIFNIMNKYTEGFDLNKDKNEWFACIKELAPYFNFCTDNKLYKKEPQNYNGNISDLCTIIRVGITGKTNTPDLCSICKVLGEKELKNRVSKVLDKLKK